MVQVEDMNADDARNVSATCQSPARKAREKFTLSEILRGVQRAAQEGFTSTTLRCLYTLPGSDSVVFDILKDRGFKFSINSYRDVIQINWEDENKNL